MIVPAKIMFFLSATGVSFSVIVTSFFTGMLSPVSAASCVAKLWHLISLASAEILSPVSRTSKSPGTMFSALIISSFPSLMTLALGDMIFFRASIAFSALYSWAKPIIAFNTTITLITQKSVHSSAIPLIIIAAINIHTILLLNCARNIFRGADFCSPTILFGPYSSSLFLASASLNPFSVVFSSVKTSFISTA